ncbi:TauD/TfdA family dioxygenase [Nocardiopsis alba]|uniref:TauD/TfdA family dioxygenase n=1 Tax=Nocardiopsis alba TaxID=53437 RepID=UPI0035D8137B
MERNDTREKTNGIILTSEEAEHIAALALGIAERNTSTSDDAFLADARRTALEVPSRVRDLLADLAEGRGAGHRVISGHRVDDGGIGPTPEDWRGRPRPNREFPAEIPLVLYAFLLGRPFAWPTQQDGNLVNDVFPIREYEHERLGTGSRTPLTFHTEDSFHPERADHLVLASLRNPDRVPLIVSEPILSELDRRHVGLLFEKRFTIVPDDSHRAINNTGAAMGDARDFEGIERRFEEREPVSVLFGDRSDPRLRFDGSYMEAEAGDEELAGALRAMRENIERNRIECALDVGDLVLLDNHRVVHARSSFTARYDGTDRWLKRVNVRSARRSGVPG